MYSPEQEWYDKKKVLSIFTISERTYFRRMGQLTPNIRTKLVKNRRGKPSTLIYYRDLHKVFKVERIHKNHLKDDQKLVGTLDWDYFVVMTPGKTKKDEMKSKMEFIYQQIRKNDKKSKLFYSIENNPLDKFCHSHFLVRTKMDKNNLKRIINQVCEEYIPKDNRRLYLENYDYDKFHYRGSFYSYKYGKSDLKHGSEKIYSKLWI
jgi:hypothetical protein